MTIDALLAPSQGERLQIRQGTKHEAYERAIILHLLLGENLLS
jgi:hypothetical protein